MRIHTLLLSLLMTAISFTSNAQFCGYDSDAAETARLLRNKKAYKTNGPQRSVVDIYIPITFHIVSETNGTGGIDEDRVIAQLCALNEDYNPHGIYFYLKDKTFNYVKSTILFSSPSAQSAGTKMITEKINNGKNSVNIFICENADTGGTSGGTTLGYYDPFLDAIVIRKQDVNAFTGTLSHELGHFFSLDHTFNGWDSEAYDPAVHGNPVSSMFSPGGVQNELADGSNCENAGDFLCDTPADYNLGLGWPGCTPYTGGAKDFNGEELDPDEENFMGYFIGCDEYHFSDLQIEMVIADYQSNDRDFLNSVSYVPSLNLNLENTTLVAPANAATVETYNYVKLEWTQVSGADGYIVEVTQGITNSIYISPNPYLHITDLEADKTYRWKVLPYSEVGGCASFTTERIVKTGNILASSELSQIGISLYPTVIEGGSEVIIESSGSYDGNVSIFDVQGKLLNNFELNLQSGLNRIYDTPSQAGLYFVSVETLGQQQTFKLVVQ